MSDGTGRLFALGPSSSIVVPRGSHAAWAVAVLLAQVLRRSTGYGLPVSYVGPAAAPGQIVLELTRRKGEREGYALDVQSEAATLAASRPVGLFRGIQTLLQLFPPTIESSVRQAGPWTIEPVRIVDYPRFPWRGVELDVARHFFTVTQVEHLIDLFALYKFNVLHLHLTDDQGWRLDIPGWPLLTSVGGSTEVGGGPGGAYTATDYTTIVRYAATRYMTVVPEVDMPSHVGAALASYPKLGCDGPALGGVPTATRSLERSLCVGSPQVTQFTNDVIGELARLTPGPYIDIGGDEALDVPRPQYYAFIQAAQTAIRAAHKTMTGWAPGIDAVNLTPGTVLQYWSTLTGQGTGTVAAAVAWGAKVVMSPGNRAYLDMQYAPGLPGQGWAGPTSVQSAYDWDPSGVLEGIQAQDILGIEGCLWSTHLHSLTEAETMLLPRLPGLAEIAWSTLAVPWDEYKSRLAAQAARWRALGLAYYASPDIAWS